ncbi:PKD domain-containing protein [Iodobacter ciconiae]|uniref:PKD domain-containing protein n=1 Tax=Iodobacter ciconiae TaxID=2496266 RepID=A0A3S8ZPR1_9NEIS|nr:PKD domain-containing protein [Iodobacter ciconiae]AZN35463.1 PKD domain-containing protein [Iodobacter ciconiae]
MSIDQAAPEGRMLFAAQTGPSSVEWRFSATDSLSGVERLRLQIASDASFANLLLDTPLSASTTSYNYAAAIAGQRLFGRIIVTDLAGNVSDPSISSDVQILPPPQAAFTANILTGEAPLEPAFQNTSAGEATAYLWNFGDGRSSSTTNPSVRYTQPGVYAVILRASGLGGSTEVSKDITVTPDVTKPVINLPTINGAPISSTVLIQKAETIYFGVSDASGVDGVRAEMAGSAVALQNLGGGSYQFNIDPLQYANGDYVLSLVVNDVAGNTTTLNVPVNINLPPPGAPTLSSVLPAKTNQASVRVRGSSPLGAEAQFYLNGIAQSSWIPVISQIFEADLILSEGINTITAVVRNNRGISTASNGLSTIFDTSKPNGPSGLTASSLAQGKVRLAWMPSQDAASVGHVVWRSISAFDAPAQGTLLTLSPIAGASFEDMPPIDGNYYYRVASVNQLGTYSKLSNAAQATADNAVPKALSITYTSLGKVDAATGRYGQGRVNLVLTTSEALQTVPYLSVVPQGGAPIPVELQKVSETVYNGNFLVDANTPSGVANLLFSARDMVGNRGTEVLAGATLHIDTQGPTLSSITLNPAAPIKNDSAQLVQATFGFSKSPALTPQIKYLLSGPLRSSVAVANLTRTNNTTYTASFSLPSDAGLGGSESLSFSHQSQDDLDNVSTKVPAFNRHQVYQGSLPPLDAPFGFGAKALAGGKVKLMWQAVSEAGSYQIYRQAPGGTLQALTRTAGIEYIDQTPADGRYSYAIATVRQANGQESLSAQTAAIEVLASATAPGAPHNLTLNLTGQGIYAAWQPPLSSTVDYYNLYRANGTTISNIEGLTPIKVRIKSAQIYDTSPSPKQGAYVVTAVDAAGNESAISNSAYLNASLLPVRDVQIEQLDSNLPVISWTVPNGNVSGYLVYVGPDASKSRLSPNPVTSTRITDTGFTSGERRYTIASIDANGVEMPRTVLLPSISSQVVSGLPIKRGIMNKLQVQVANTSAVSIGGVRAVVRLPVDRDAIQFKDHKSEPVTLAPNQTLLVPVIVGGYADLPGAPTAQVGVEIAANEGELVKVVRNQTVNVVEGALVVGMASDEFTRGGTGKLKLTIENTSEVDIELLTATHNGANESNELRFKLLDADNNILATQAYKQVFGANIVTLTNGQTVARIPAGSTYVSDTFNLNVPAASPNSIRVRLEVDKLRYHSGQEDEVQIAGRGSERTVSLSDTAYFGKVTQVTPITSFGDQDIVISGHASDRASNTPLPNTRLKLILNQQGFERNFNVLTDASGEFVYTFKPSITDAGLYKVSAVHPEITDRPEQKAFTINRVIVGPTPYKLDVPKNYPFMIPFTARAGVGTSATNLRLILNAASQPTGQIPAGVSVQLPAPLSLAERQTLNLPVQFTANNEAQPSGTLIFDVLSDEHASTPIAQVRVDFTLSEAKPYLISTPSLIETGLAQGSSQVESVTVKNNGLQDALNLQFMLSKTDGNPAPAWASIGSAANGTLAIGQSRSIDLAFSPPAGTPEGIYEFKLKVSGDNVPSQSLNVYVSLTQSGQGSVLFKAADIYTATIGKNGKLIPGLVGASITLQNEDVPTVSQELVTDVLGEALFQNLPAGRYKFRAKASNHQEIGGRLIIKPGITANQPVFLDYNLISVEWSVREITIQDRYEITLNATFETDVPAAVVVMQPTGINLPKMAAGDVFYGELNLTNYGLIRADNVKQRLPQGDAYFRYEFLVDVPATLEAKQRVTIPYRVIALQSLETAANSGTASGGGCHSYSNNYAVTCEFVCANGVQSSCSASTSWFSVSNSSCGGGAGVGSGGGGGGGGVGGGFGGGGSSTTILMKNKKCVYVPKGGMQCD